LLFENNLHFLPLFLNIFGNINLGLGTFYIYCANAKVFFFMFEADLGLVNIFNVHIKIQMINFGLNLLFIIIYH